MTDSLKPRVENFNEDDHVFQEDFKQLMLKHLKPDTKERLLALAANTVGRLLALQDQRTMTNDRAMAIVIANIQVGNKQQLEPLFHTKGRMS